MDKVELPDFDIEDTDRCEEQVKLEVITPALEKAGWPKKQLRMEQITSGRMMLDRSSCKRDKRVRKLDYLLISKGGKGLAVVEAKKVSDAALVSIEQAKKESEKQIRREVGEIALQIAEKVLRKNVSSDQAQRELVDKYLNEVETKN